MLELHALTLLLALSSGQTLDEEDEPPPSAELDDSEDPERPHTVPQKLVRYQFVQAQRVDIADGVTKVAVEANTQQPAFGTFPIRVFVDNTTGPRQTLNFSFSGNVVGGLHRVERSVEVNAGERRVVYLPAPVEMRYGNLRVSGPGITKGGDGAVYFAGSYGAQKIVLSLSSADQFESFIGKKPNYSRADVLVHPIPPREAPAELASYVGYDAVLIPDSDTLETLDEAQRRALEAYAATGGHLIIKGPLRAASVFPLLDHAPRKGQSSTAYGWGELIVLDEKPTPPIVGRSAAITPRGAMPEYMRGRSNTDALLPQATAPLGRFLLIITAFTLAIGPGSIWVARRRGPAALLVTIPGTAFVTCVAIIGYSLISDGFTVHGATYGFTLLDRTQHRAVTVGLTAYYANLAPGKVTFSASSLPIAPHGENQESFVSDMNWRDGLTMGSDFLPSRVYREWGFLSVEPTRARLVLKADGSKWIIQNALGHTLEDVTVLIDGKDFVAHGVADGKEATLARGSGPRYRASKANGRFDARVAARTVQADLRDGEFLAHIRGEGFVPTGGVRPALHESEHWVRGEVER